MPEFFSPEGFMPHGHCYLWKPGLVGLHLVSDVLIAFAYTSIPFTLLYFIRRRRDVPFRWIFLWFGLFIVSCGGTHVFEAWNLYHADYWLAGFAKAFTAVASLATAFLLVRVIPEAIALPSPEDLRRVNERLRLAQEGLERRVGERTRALSEANAALGLQAQLLASVQNIVLAFDGAGVLTYWNRRAEEALGWPAREALGRAACEILPVAETGQRSTDGGERMAVDGTWEGEIQVTRRHGGTFPAWVTQSPTRDETGKVTGAVWVVADLTERRGLEDSLKRSERFRNLFDHAAVGMAVRRLDGRFLHVNPALCTLLGYEERELLDRDFQAVSHPADLPGELDRVRSMLSGGVPGFVLNNRYLRKDGVVVWARTSVTLVRDGAGDPQGMITIVQDVTRQQRAEQALWESEVRYRRLVESARELIATVDLEGRFTSFNSSFQALTGWEKEEWLGRHFTEIVHPDDVAGCRTVFEAALQGEAPPPITHRLRTRTGDWLILESTGTPLVRDGGVTAVLGVARDVTARVRAEEALAESRRRLRAIFENALDAILLLDDEGRYVDVNPAATALLGWEREDLLRMSARDVTPAVDQARIGEAMRSFAATGSYSGDYRLLCKDGRVRDTEFRAVANILPRLHLAIVRDVTGRVQAEGELRRRERLFAEAEKVAHVGCWEWSPSEDSVIWSEETYRLFGVTPETFEPTYERFLRFVHPEQRRFVEEQNDATIRYGSTLEYDLRIVRPNGEPRYLHVRGHRVEDPDRGAARLTGVVQDITQMRRDEQTRQELLSRLLAVHEKEQARISRELHDGAGQWLTAALVGLRRIEDALSLNEAKRVAVRQRELVSATIDELGRLARGLRPTLLEDLGLRGALRTYATDRARLFGLEASVRTENVGRLPRDLEAALYRTAQEAISNVARHAQARRVTISLARHLDLVRLTIADDGCGFDLGRLSAARGRLGLSGIRERAHILGGHAEIRSAPGSGTTISVVVPVRQTKGRIPGKRRNRVVGGVATRAR